MRFLRSRADRRPGSAAVELAIVAPLLVLLMMGLWEYGRMVEARQILDNAAREGARYASGGNVTAAQVTTFVGNYLTAAGVSNAGMTVSVYNLTLNPSPGTGDPSDDPMSADQMHRLEVRVTLPFNNYRWIIMDKFAYDVTLASRAEWACMKDEPLVVDSEMPIN